MKNLSRLLAFVLLCSFTPEAKAQKNEWKKLGEDDGVTVYWRWRQLYKNSYTSELKLENSNPFNVEVTVMPAFTCPDGIEYKQGGVVTLVTASGIRMGEQDGLAFYPCQGEKIPRKAALEKLKVNRK